MLSHICGYSLDHRPGSTDSGVLSASSSSSSSSNCEKSTLMSLRAGGFEGVVASFGDDLGVSIRLDVLEKD